jgi:hypothetical protein
MDIRQQISNHRMRSIPQISSHTPLSQKNLVCLRSKSKCYHSPFEEEKRSNFVKFEKGYALPQEKMRRLQAPKYHKDMIEEELDSF